jgi:hypothetical protein
MDSHALEQNDDGLYFGEGANTLDDIYNTLCYLDAAFQISGLEDDTTVDLSDEDENKQVQGGDTCAPDCRQARVEAEQAHHDHQAPCALADVQHVAANHQPAVRTHTVVPTRLPARVSLHAQRRRDSVRLGLHSDFPSSQFWPRSKFEISVSPPVTPRGFVTIDAAHTPNIINDNQIDAVNQQHKRDSVVDLAPVRRRSTRIHQKSSSRQLPRNRPEQRPRKCNNSKEHELGTSKLVAQVLGVRNNGNSNTDDPLFACAS